VTAVTEAHLAYLGSLETIAIEKGRLVEALPPAEEGGLAILNYDDPRVRAMASRTRARIITYGRDPDADLVAGAVKADSQGVSFTVFVKDFLPLPGRQRQRRLRVHLPLLGEHNVYAALAAVAAGLALEVPLTMSTRPWLPSPRAWPWRCPWRRRYPPWLPSGPCAGG